MTIDQYGICICTEDNKGIMNALERPHPIRTLSIKKARNLLKLRAKIEGGGDEGIRTLGLYRAKVALSQLSYIPEYMIYINAGYYFFIVAKAGTDDYKKDVILQVIAASQQRVIYFLKLLCLGFCVVFFLDVLSA